MHDAAHHERLNIFLEIERSGSSAVEECRHRALPQTGLLFNGATL